MSKILIFGHKSPDTDSVTAAITLSYLKNKLGFNTIPKMLGSLNNETKFVLDYFKTKAPDYLSDVKLRISDINYQNKYYLTKDNSIYKSYLYMNDNNISSLPVVDEESKLIGMVSIKDIAKHQIINSNKILETSLKNIIETVNGKIIAKHLESFYLNIKTEVFIYQNNFPGNINDYKLFIVSNDSKLASDKLRTLEENKITVIKSPLSFSEINNKIMLANYISTITTNVNLIYFNEDTYITDFIEIANETKYSNYPIIDKNNICLGTLRLSDLGTEKRKKVILVDHNEASQSVDGLEEADIIEIIDHHKIGNISTNEPISFRNMPVGSTNTIIYLLYQENNINIPKDIAGLMISGILSDTLILTSPTTTDIDKMVVSKLEKIAEIDHYKYGVSMFEAGSSLQGKTLEEILFSDFKDFNMAEFKVGIGQVFTLNINEIKKQKDDFLKIINNTAIKNNYKIVALFITDIINNGSYILYNEEAEELIQKSFGIDKIKQFYYIENCVSRKKQIVPNIMKTIENK